MSSAVGDLPYRSNSADVSSLLEWRDAFVGDMEQVLTFDSAAGPVLSRVLLPIIAGYCTPSFADLLRCTAWMRHAFDGIPKLVIGLGENEGTEFLFAYSAEPAGHKARPIAGTEYVRRVTRSASDHFSLYAETNKNGGADYDAMYTGHRIVFDELLGLFVDGGGGPDAQFRSRYISSFRGRARRYCEIQYFIMPPASSATTALPQPTEAPGLCFKFTNIESTDRPEWTPGQHMYRLF